MDYEASRFLIGRTLTVSGQPFTISGASGTVGNSETTISASATSPMLPGFTLNGTVRCAPLADPAQQRAVFQVWGSALFGPTNMPSGGTFDATLTWNPPSVTLAEGFGTAAGQVLVEGAATVIGQQPSVIQRQETVAVVVADAERVAAERGIDLGVNANPNLTVTTTRRDPTPPEGLGVTFQPTQPSDIVSVAVQAPMAPAPGPLPARNPTDVLNAQATDGTAPAPKSGFLIPALIVGGIFFALAFRPDRG